MEQLTKNSNATHSASRSSPIVTKAAYSGRTGLKGMKEAELRHNCYMKCINMGTELIDMTTEDIQLTS